MIPSPSALGPKEWGNHLTGALENITPQSSAVWNDAGT